MRRRLTTQMTVHPRSSRQMEALSPSRILQRAGALKARACRPLVQKRYIFGDEHIHAMWLTRRAEEGVGRIKLEIEAVWTPLEVDSHSSSMVV